LDGEAAVAAIFLSLFCRYLNVRRDALASRIFLGSIDRDDDDRMIGGASEEWNTLLGELVGTRKLSHLLSEFA